MFVQAWHWWYFKSEKMSGGGGVLKPGSFLLFLSGSLLVRVLAWHTVSFFSGSCFVFLFSRRACFCWHVYLPQRGCQMDLSLSPVRSLSLSFSFLFFFSLFFFSLVCGLVLCFVLPQCSRGRKLREVLGFSTTCKRELLCHGQGLARSLLPSAVVRRNSTAINCRSLLMFTSVLSGTLVTGSCSEEHLRSKDSFTYWHPWSR